MNDVLEPEAPKVALKPSHFQTSLVFLTRKAFVTTAASSYTISTVHKISTVHSQYSKYHYAASPTPYLTYAPPPAPFFLGTYACDTIAEYDNVNDDNNNNRREEEEDDDDEDDEFSAPSSLTSNGSDGSGVASTSKTAASSRRRPSDPAILRIGQVQVPVEVSRRTRPDTRPTDAAKLGAARLKLQYDSNPNNFTRKTRIFFYRSWLTEGRISQATSIASHRELS